MPAKLSSGRLSQEEHSPSRAIPSSGQIARRISPSRSVCFLSTRSDAGHDSGASFPSQLGSWASNAAHARQAFRTFAIRWAASQDLTQCQTQLLEACQIIARAPAAICRAVTSQVELQSRPQMHFAGYFADSTKLDVRVARGVPA